MSSRVTPRFFQGWRFLLLLTIFILAIPALHAEEPRPAGGSAGTELVPKTDLPPSDLGTETQPMADLFVPKETVELRINLPATRLDLYVNGQYRKSYKVAIGMPKYPTPIRDYSMTHINWNPWWIPPDSEWAANAEKTPPGPGNPLGPVKMMMENGIRIHGTNAPGSIGRATSHACMRMKNADAVELAWEIQQRYSEKTDPELLEKYNKHRRSPFWVKLGLEVPVSVNYILVEQEGDKFIIHPDRYGRGNLQKELEILLAAHPEIVIDKGFLKKLNKKRVKGSLEITLEEMKALCAPPDIPSPSTAAVPKPL